MQASAKLSQAHISAQKCRLVADQIRGLPVERALEVLQSGGLIKLFESALQAAKQRSIELADKLGA